MQNLIDSSKVFALGFQMQVRTQLRMKDANLGTKKQTCDLDHEADIQSRA